MYLYDHIVPLFIVILSSPICFSSNLERQHWTKYDQSHRLNPTSGVARMAEYDTRTVDLPRFYRVGATSSSTKVVNVDDFGAKGDGRDDSQAFKKAWREACASKNAVLVVPKNRVYHLKPITFSGPCESNLTMKIYGTIKASNKLSDYDEDPSHWIQFENIPNFRIEGGGTFNGNGRKWWRNSCKINPSLPCNEAPTAVTFSECKNLGVSHLRFKNSQKMHLAFQKCVNVVASNLIVVAPEKSPNTDGIHVTATSNIQIQSSVIRTGDDCISIVSGSNNVKVRDITCGPGHGISIGSLGKGNSEAFVSNVFVSRSTLSGTTNGVRIKTWQGGSGYAKNIMFQDIVMRNVSNPIIINQNYCDQTNPCPQQESGVQVKNVWYKNIIGTSASEDAITFDCSKSIPCQGIGMQNINIVQESSNGNAKASCDNVRFSAWGKVSPSCSSDE